MSDQGNQPPIPGRGNLIRSRALARRPKGRNHGATSGTRILAKEKQRRAMELRKSGATYEAIARAVGYAEASSARKAVVTAMQDTIQEPAQELRTLQVERLNHMLLVIWGQIQNGDTKAIDTGLRIMDKLDRLLGTESPAKVDVVHDHSGAVLVIDGNKDEYIAAMKKMAGMVEAQASPVTRNPLSGTGDEGAGSGVLSAVPVQLDPAPVQIGNYTPGMNHPEPEVVHTPGTNGKKFDFTVEPGGEDDK